LALIKLQLMGTLTASPAVTDASTISLQIDLTAPLDTFSCARLQSVLLNA
jgi:hypothetical protein